MTTHLVKLLSGLGSHAIRENTKSLLKLGVINLVSICFEQKYKGK